MTPNIGKQIDFLINNNILNYEIENSVLIICQDVTLYQHELDSDLLQGVVIHGNLHLPNLYEISKDFLKESFVNGYLNLGGIYEINTDILINTIINGDLFLSGVTEFNTDILTTTIINFDLYLSEGCEFHDTFLKNVIVNGEVCGCYIFDASELNKRTKKLELTKNSKFGYGYDIVFSDIF